MKQIVLDTETTGLDPNQGHRLIEIACIKLDGRQVSKAHWHQYFDPEREVDEGAAKVHGMTWDDLKGKPLFADLADDFLRFVDGSELIIHNAPFDIGFINAELARLGKPAIDTICSVVDTLPMARELFPGKRNSLDALCERYAIDNSHRVLHGALLDTELLAEVYLAMSRGQESLDFGFGDNQAEESQQQALAAPSLLPRVSTKLITVSADELAAHQRVLEGIGKSSKGECLWLKAKETDNQHVSAQS